MKEAVVSMRVSCLSAPSQGVCSCFEECFGDAYLSICIICIFSVHLTVFHVSYNF